MLGFLWSLSHTSKQVHTGLQAPVSKANQASMNKDSLKEEEHGGVGDCFSGEVEREQGEVNQPRKRL